MADYRGSLAAVASLLLFVVLRQIVPGAARADDRPRLDGYGSQFIYLRPLQEVKPTRFRDADGRAIDLAEFRGKVVLVNIWATWCAPCVREMPALDRLQAEIGGDRFVVVAIALDAAGLPPVVEFFRQRKLAHLHIYLDPRHHTISSVAGPASFRLYALPMSYLLDEQGRAVGYLTGPADWSSPQAIRFLEYFVAKARHAPQ